MSKYKIVQLAHPGKEWPAFSNSKNTFVNSKIGIQWNEDFSAGIREWNNLMSHKENLFLPKMQFILIVLRITQKKVILHSGVNGSLILNLK